MKNERELIQQLKGRAELCRDRGEVKTPELLERAIKALEQREGYKLVPVEPTEEMLDIYESYSVAPIGRLSKRGYKHMIEAA